MGIYENAADRKQAGFTLVELAVVMIIIGLLIGGVLKGQELIANAQITGTASAYKGIDAATTTFRDTYAAMPGDMGANAANRLPNCNAAPCNNASNGDGRVTGAFNAVPSAEMDAFWAQLSAADLITGIDPTMNAADTSWGGQQPKAPISGGFHAAFSNAALGTNANTRAGHYLLLNNAPGAAFDSTALTPLQAARLDRKIDDGTGLTGTVFPSVAACIDANGVYLENNSGVTCDLFIRFQN